VRQVALPADPPREEEVGVRIFRGRSPLTFLFARTRREQYLEQYVLREHRTGRALAEILDDPYVRNRSTPAERERLFERPELVAALGEDAVRELARVRGTAQAAGRSR
jgi:hypothetical protein